MESIEVEARNASHQVRSVEEALDANNTIGGHQPRPRLETRLGARS